MTLIAHCPVPIFPLPNVVLFPRIVLPLHIFEPRYRKMLSDVIDSHGMIALALLKPGWEADYHGNPEVYPVVTVGSIVTYQTREDGTSDIILVGSCRAQIIEWAESEEYRTARLAELGETPPRSTSGRDALRRRLGECLRRLTRDAQRNEDLQRLQKIFASERDIGFLVDFLTYRFLDTVEEKQDLLEELKVEQRAEKLFEALEKRGAM